VAYALNDRLMQFAARMVCGSVAGGKYKTDSMVVLYEQAR